MRPITDRPPWRRLARAPAGVTTVLAAGLCWAVGTTAVLAGIVVANRSIGPTHPIVRPRLAAAELRPWCEPPPEGTGRSVLRDVVAEQLRREGVPRPQGVAQVLASEAELHEVDPLLVLALIEVESDYRTQARSSAGAIGLLQVRPDTAREIAHQIGLSFRGPEALLEPETNVHVGILYLSKLVDQFDDLEHALAAYNQGPAAVSRALAEGRTVPRAYVERVWQTYRDLGDEFQSQLTAEAFPVGGVSEPATSIES